MGRQSCSISFRNCWSSFPTSSSGSKVPGLAKICLRHFTRCARLSALSGGPFPSSSISVSAVTITWRRAENRRLNIASLSRPNIATNFGSKDSALSNMAAWFRGASGWRAAHVAAGSAGRLRRFSGPHIRARGSSVISNGFHRRQQQPRSRWLRRLWLRQCASPPTSPASSGQTS
jgi:hypothetical protein